MIQRANDGGAKLCWQRRGAGGAGEEEENGGKFNCFVASEIIIKWNNRKKGRKEEVDKKIGERNAAMSVDMSSVFLGVLLSATRQFMVLLSSLRRTSTAMFHSLHLPFSIWALWQVHSSACTCWRSGTSSLGVIKRRKSRRRGRGRWRWSRRSRRRIVNLFDLSFFFTGIRVELRLFHLPVGQLSHRVPQPGAAPGCPTSSHWNLIQFDALTSTNGPSA